ncbi:MAG: hypothetical protein H0S85_02335 [Desulfovibrionaceae bacterium]|jgi:hypothetical protein|nr:hypothetical protein [Desulfovibrionaceae bacterium]
METTHKELALMAQLARGLLAHGERSGMAQLGDRTRYVGMSDLGKAMRCMRAAVADKSAGSGLAPDQVAQWFAQGAEERICATLHRQLVLQRGHWLEEGVRQALLANGAPLIPQLGIEATIQHGTTEVPVRAHLDFVLLRGGERPAIRVLELKSTEHLPKTLHPAYEMQVYGQLGMLATCWGKPCVNLRDGDGTPILSGQTFPEVAQHLFGITLPASSDRVDIEGWVLCLSMAEARAFGPYRPDAAMHDLAMRLAGELWTNLQRYTNGRVSLDDLDYCHGFHPLCDWCDHYASCPKFSTRQALDPACNAALQQLDALRSQRKDLDQEIKRMEERIETHYARLSGAGDWLATGDYRCKVAPMPGRVTLNRAMLQAELANSLGQKESDRILSLCTDTGRPFTRLFFGRTPRPATPSHEERIHVAA